MSEKPRGGIFLTHTVDVECVVVQGEMSILSNGAVAVRCPTYLLLDSGECRSLGQFYMDSLCAFQQDMCICMVRVLGLCDGTVDVTGSCELLTFIYAEARHLLYGSCCTYVENVLRVLTRINWEVSFFPLKSVR